MLHLVSAAEAGALVRVELSLGRLSVGRVVPLTYEFWHGELRMQQGCLPACRVWHLVAAGFQLQAHCLVDAMLC